MKTSSISFINFLISIYVCDNQVNLTVQKNYFSLLIKIKKMFESLKEIARKSYDENQTKKLDKSYNFKKCYI